MKPDVAALVAAAVAAGRVTRLPAGATSRAKVIKPAEPVRFRPEHCGCGGEVSRQPRLDEIDGEM